MRYAIEVRAVFVRHQDAASTVALVPAEQGLLTNAANRAQLARMRYLPALLLIGCTTSRQVMAPSGGVAWHIECPNPAACMDEAAEKCPRGYEVVDRGQRNGGYVQTSPQTGQQTVVPTSRGTLTIECTH